MATGGWDGSGKAHAGMPSDGVRCVGAQVTAPGTACARPGAGQRASSPLIDRILCRASSTPGSSSESARLRINAYSTCAACSCPTRCSAAGPRAFPAARRAERRASKLRNDTISDCVITAGSGSPATIARKLSSSLRVARATSSPSSRRNGRPLTAP